VAASRQREAGFAGEGVSRTDIDLGNPSAYWSAMGEDKISLEFLAACVAAPTDRVNDLDLRMQNIETEIRDLKSRFAALEQRFTALEEGYSIPEARHPRADRRSPSGRAGRQIIGHVHQAGEESVLALGIGPPSVPLEFQICQAGPGLARLALPMTLVPLISQVTTSPLLFCHKRSE
jgi:hypothetical protein